MSSSCRPSPRPRRAEATAIDRISASSSASRDTMNPMRLRPTMARWAMTLRSKSKRSNSPSLHPRWKETPWSAAKAWASRGPASDSTGSRANRRLTIPIIGGARARRPVGAPSAGGGSGGPGGGGAFGGGGAGRGVPVEAGGAARPAGRGRLGSLGPGRRPLVRGGPDDAGGWGHRRAGGAAPARDRGSQRGAPAGAEYLQIDLL